MPDRPTPFPPDLTIAETRAAAYHLRAMAARLLALAHQLPLLPEEDLDRILEGGERAFKDHPLLSLFVDIDTIVRDELIPAAEALEADQATLHQTMQRLAALGELALDAAGLEEVTADV